MTKELFKVSKYCKYVLNTADRYSAFMELELINPLSIDNEFDETNGGNIKVFPSNIYHNEAFYQSMVGYFEKFLTNNVDDDIDQKRFRAFIALFYLKHRPQYTYFYDLPSELKIFHNEKPFKLARWVCFADSPDIYFHQIDAQLSSDDIFIKLATRDEYDF